MAEKGTDAGPSNILEESLEESLGLASETFDPMHVLYAPSLGYADENVEAYDSVSQFMRNFNEIPSPGKEKSSAPLDSTTAFTSTVSRSLAVLDTDLSIPDVEKESVNNVTAGTYTDLASEQTSSLSQLTDQQKVQLEHKEKIDDEKCETMGMTDESAKQTDEPEKPSIPHRKMRLRRSVLTEMETGFEYGPLNILKRSVKEKLKVRVWTRSVRNIRGISTGYVVAFDKHMNLAMIDVDEVYRKPLGKHQKKSKKPEVKVVPCEEGSQGSDKAEAQPCYPKTPWQRLGPSVSGANRDSSDEGSGDHSNGHTETSPPADGIGDLPSAFSGMHVFEENKETRLLGAKSRRVLSRHFNQVLLRGDHVVAVALDE